MIPLPPCSIPQFYDGDRFPAVFFALKRRFGYQRLRLQIFGQALTERTGSVPMNDADLRQMRQRRVVEEFVHKLGGLLDRHANHVDFTRSRDLSRSRFHGYSRRRTLSNKRRSLNPSYFIERDLHPQRSRFDFRGIAIDSAKNEPFPKAA